MCNKYCLGTTNLESAFSIIHLVVGGTILNDQPWSQCAIFALSILKGVVYEATHKLQRKLNRSLYSLGAYIHGMPICMGVVF